MNIEIRNDSVILDGYVNVTGKDSKLIPSVKGRFKEQVTPGAFTKALERAVNVDLLLNHDKNKKLGSIKEGNLSLQEDNIGLKAHCTITDKDVIEKARNNELRGWSFGFYADKDRWEDLNEGLQRRFLDELALNEVSIIDNTKNPAYVGTSIEVRADQEVLKEVRNIEDIGIITDKTIIGYDNSKFKEIIKEIRGVN